MPTTYGQAAERIRMILAAEPSTREVSMFGGLSFMVNDKMIVNVRRGGDLLVRVDPSRSPELVADHGARFAEMGAGRAMGPGWIDVAAELTATDSQLRFWLDVAMEFNYQTAGEPGTRRAPAARDTEAGEETAVASTAPTADPLSTDEPVVRPSHTPSSTLFP